MPKIKIATFQLKTKHIKQNLINKYNIAVETSVFVLVISVVVVKGGEA
jgi:hypothetical protein